MTTIIKPTLVTTEDPPRKDDFDDLESLKLSQDFTAMAGTRKLITRIPVRPPKKFQWFKVRADAEHRFQASLLKDVEGERDDVYLVNPLVAAEVQEETYAAALYQLATRRGSFSLWAIPITDNSWHKSAHEAAEMGMERFIRIDANRETGGYDITVSEHPMPEPEWPALNMSEVLRIAFGGGRYIQTIEHPMLLKRQGLA
jgi:hypothetical protein